MATRSLKALPTPLRPHSSDHLIREDTNVSGTDRKYGRRGQPLPPTTWVTLAISLGAGAARSTCRLFSSTRLGVRSRVLWSVERHNIPAGVCSFYSFSPSSILRFGEIVGSNRKPCKLWVSLFLFRCGFWALISPSISSYFQSRDWVLVAGGSWLQKLNVLEKRLSPRRTRHQPPVWFSVAL